MWKQRVVQRRREGGKEGGKEGRDVMVSKERAMRWKEFIYIGTGTDVT